MDWKWTVTAVLSVVTLVLGALLNQWTASRLEKAQRRREQELRELERAQARLDRREEFELAHLNDLYAALGELQDAALIYKAHLESESLPEDLRAAASKFSEADTKVKRLGDLVLDDDDRKLVGDAHDVTVRACMPAALGGSAIMTTMHQARYQLGRAQYAVAARIREVYKTDAPALPAKPGTHN
ncbi:MULTISPECIES: hypothetical protein [Streptomyces]|uniref:Lysis protein n=1 Tax=Streptomyces hokutonensis TaxID=1306990 RepID=A0ABW6M772_9ACTN|nr:hypothetical protein OG504_39300 [Streptomyces sp. NBC_00986]